MKVVFLDLEGVLVPEIWHALAEKTGIENLKLTTRDIRDYEELMNIRISTLNDNRVKAKLLFKIAEEIKPFENAVEFLIRLKRKYQVIVLSDTFSNLSSPIFEKLGWPTVFCHELLVDKNDMIRGFKFCIKNHKMLAVKALNKLNFKTVAVGDSYNDINMLKEANQGFLFRSTEDIIRQYQIFPHFHSYEDLLEEIDKKFKNF